MPCSLSRASHGTGIRPLFWPSVIAFNLVGTGDLILAYYHAIQVGLPAHAGRWLASAYVIPVLYVPLLMITHVVALSWLVRPQSKATPTRIGDATVA